MRYSLFDLRNIQNKEIREYFSEVLRCYENESYRSSILVLYTVVLYDLFFKLKELSDEYGDSIATQILCDVEREMIQNKDKSSWENLLIQKLHNHQDFEILDANLYSTLRALKDKRNLSAHPSFSGDEIYQPTREIVLGFIKEVYDNLLIRPPMLIKKQVQIILNFLDSHKYEFNPYNFYLNNVQNKTFSEYFKNKYYGKLGKSFKIKLINTLWKFTFENVGEIYDENRYINLFILSYIYHEDKELFTHIIQDKIENKTIYDVIAFDVSKSFNYFCIFLSENPEIYNLLTEEYKTVLKEKFSTVPGVYFVYERFMFDNLRQFLNELSSTVQIHYLKDTKDFQIMYLSNLCFVCGDNKSFANFCLTLLSKVPTWSGFEFADLIMEKMIIPNCNLFDEEDFYRYKSIVEGNDQISSRYNHGFQNSQIKNVASTKGIEI